MAKRRTEFHREFFDRDYTAGEAYSRLAKYASRYKFRLIVGVVCGMCTAFTLLPLYQTIKPALAIVETRKLDEPAAATKTEWPKTAEAPAAAPANDAVGKSAKKLEKEYDKVRGVASRFGLEMQGEDEAVGLPLLFIVIILVPLVALLRCALVFLNHYCLAWAGIRTVRDIRCDMLRHVQSQSMQFHGRIGAVRNRGFRRVHRVQRHRERHAPDARAYNHRLPGVHVPRRIPFEAHPQMVSPIPRTLFPRRQQNPRDTHLHQGREGV